MDISFRKLVAAYMDKLDALNYRVAMIGLFDPSLIKQSQRRLNRDFEELFEVSSCDVAAVIEQLRLLKPSLKIDGKLESKLILPVAEVSFLLTLLIDMLLANTDLVRMEVSDGQNSEVVFRFHLKGDVDPAIFLDHNAYSGNSERALFSLYFPYFVHRWGGRYISHPEVFALYLPGKK